ncbi:uncharacterized protein [Ptychodera flava]|uniref:uncharacterized protein n=1 Tax=Ptychodera flava TaxID=63121 RepID=UPI00396A5E4B
MAERKSVLLVNDEWGTAKGGISTVHRQLARLATETGQDVHCLALKASDDDRNDALEKGINLILPRAHGGTEPTLDWLLCHDTFYRHLRQEVGNVAVIIGHFPITDAAAVKLKEDVFPSAKLFLFNHVISENIEVYKESWTPERVEKRERQALEAASKADLIFSVGPRMFDHFRNKFRAIPGVEKKHQEFIPLPDSHFFDVNISNPEITKVKQVITFGRITGVEKLKGYDLVARAMSEVVKSFNFMRRPVPQWIVRGVPKGEGQQTKEDLGKHITCKDLIPTLYPYGSQAEIRRDLEQSHLCIMASRSEPFGLVGFEAIATGIPVLVTKNSGLAQFLQEQFPEIAKLIVVDVGVNENFDDKDVRAWKSAILRTLNNYGTSLARAAKLKEKLRECPAIIQSHENFKRLCKEH